MKNTQILITQTLEFIAKNSNEEQSSKFLKNTAKHIAALFNVSYVFINKYSLKKPKVVETIVILGKDGLLPNKEYKLANTPCENVINRKICVYPNNLQTLFSKDEALKKMNAQSYIGVPLWSSSGEPIGLIIIIDDKPITDTKPLETSLQIIAIKVAQVLEKILLKNKLELKIIDLEQSNKKVVESEQILEEAQQIAKLGYWEFNIITNQLTWSDEVYRILNLKPQELEASEELFAQRVHPNDIDKVDNSYSNAIKTKKEYKVNYKLLFKSGEEKFIQGKGKILFNKEGEPIKSIGTILDVTQQKKSEEKFKKLANLTFEGILIHNQSIAKDVNLSFEKMFGYTAEELIGKEIVSIIFPKKYHKLIHKNRIEKYVLPYEVEGVRKDGTVFPVELEARNITVDNKEYRVAAFRDLTERNKTLVNTKKLTTAVEQSANTIVITDINGIIEYVNPKFTEVSGYTSEEAIGQNPSVLKSGNQSDEYYKNMWETISAGKSWNGEFQNKSKSGTIFWEQVTITPIKNELGNIINYLAVKEDITKRKKAEETVDLTFDLLKENEEYLTTILKTTNEGFWAIDANNLTTEVNPEMCKILGFKESDILGTSIYDFVDKKNTKIFEEQIEIRKLGIETKYEVELKNSKGKNIPCLFNTTPILNNKKERIGSFAMVTDISDLKETYKISENRNKELRKLSSELSEKNDLLLKSNDRFINLFELSPVSIWEQDFLEVLNLLNQKKAETDDIEAYMNQNPDFVKECVSKIQIINVNKATKELLGVNNVVELKKQLSATNNKRALEVLKKELTAMALGEIEFKDITELINTKGEVITAIVKSALIGDQGKAIASVIDITALKKAEKQAKESEQKFRELYEKSGDAILIINNGIFIDCNNSTLSMLGYALKKDFLNQHPSKLSPRLQSDGEESFKKADQMMSLAFKNGTHRFEWYHLRSNGDEFPVEVLLTAISNNPDNKVLHCVWRDITDRKKVLNELTVAKEYAEESETNLLKAQKIAKLGSFNLDLKTQIARSSASFDIITEFPNNENKTFEAWRTMVHPDDVIDNQNYLEKCIKEGIKYDREYRIFTKETETLKWIHTLGEIIYNNGEPTNFLGTIQDITARKKALNQLTVAKEHAEESDRLKTEFLNNMSHEIRTPMNGILGFSEMLNDPDIDMQKRSNFVNIIQNSGKQLLNVIDDILEISRLGTKQVKVIEEEVCLNDLLLELFSVFDINAKENKTPLYLKKTLSDPESIILTDRTKLNKIISNLLENALKFTNKGFIEFGYNIKNTSKIAQLEIYVKDTGIGIKPEKHQLIFERFQQAEKELTRNVGGLGLGLSIAKENTELLGGKISVESKMMEGATFLVTIPFKPINKTIQIEDKGFEYSILIAEDEEINYMYIETILQDIIKLNCNILHAKDGREAIEICRNNTIDLVLMDLKMPNLNGFLATKQIRKFNTEIPIIAQTAYSSIEDREEALAMGCNDFISKPIEKETLINIIDNYLK